MKSPIPTPLLPFLPLSTARLGKCVCPKASPHVRTLPSLFLSQVVQLFPFQPLSQVYTLLLLLPILKTKRFHYFPSLPNLRKSGILFHPLQAGSPPTTPRLTQEGHPRSRSFHSAFTGAPFCMPCPRSFLKPLPVHPCSCGPGVLGLLPICQFHSPYSSQCSSQSLSPSSPGSSALDSFAPTLWQFTTLFHSNSKTSVQWALTRTLPPKQLLHIHSASQLCPQSGLSSPGSEVIGIQMASSLDFPHFISPLLLWLTRLAGLTAAHVFTAPTLFTRHQDTTLLPFLPCCWRVAAPELEDPG